MLVVGLTGGIGSGKSTVAELFAALGAPVIDTDQLAREVVAPGSDGLRQVVAAFGPEVLGADASLDRRALRARVFAEPARRRQLEELLHPLIERRMHEHIAALAAPYCIVVIPLLVESGWRSRVERVAVVDCPPELQVARAMARDCQDEAPIRAILAAQAERSVRLAAADDIIDNSADLEHLRTQVRELHRSYLRRHRQ